MELVSYIPTRYDRARPGRATGPAARRPARAKRLKKSCVPGRSHQTPYNHHAGCLKRTGGGARTPDAHGVHRPCSADAQCHRFTTCPPGARGSTVEHDAPVRPPSRRRRTAGMVRTDGRRSQLISTCKCSALSLAATSTHVMSVHCAIRRRLAGSTRRQGSGSRRA
jgi:hypothetical protein